jgi:ABC-type polysaccharide/polyol phosphate transport system ATPase subunit
MREKTKQLQNAISVKNVSKQFSIPHERINTLKGAFVNILRKKNYESFYVLKDISFEIKKGEFFGIIGRNGSGKSTLLKILAGVYIADSGKIDIKGLISPFLELGIGFNPELSGRDNIYLNATVLGLTEKEIDAKFDSIVAFSELERFIDQKLKNYSSGMQVRLSFSVAIHANREILLMDEVLAVGDANFQQKCLDYFRKLKSQGKTIILVSHSQSSIEEYCDRVIMLENGKIVKNGLPSEVFAFYNSSLSNVDATVFNKKQEVDKNKEKDKFTQNKNEFIYKNEKRWGNFQITIDEILFDRKDKSFLAQENISGKIIVKINDKESKNTISDIDLSLAMYNTKDSLVFLDTLQMKNTEEEYIKIPFNINLPDLVEGSYRFTIRIASKDSTRNGIVYDHWDKDNQIYIKNNYSKYPGLINISSVFRKNIKVVGMIRMRNEELILQDTLDSFSKIVDGIIIYDDASDDKSVEIARKHHAVIEVIENKVWKLDRMEEETRSRQLLLEHAQHYNPEWLFYSDCDERFEGDIRSFLSSNEADSIKGIRISLFDAYMTNKDSEYVKNDTLYNFRKFFGPEKRDILMIWKNDPDVKFEGLDCREPKVNGNIITKFYCQHYGKSLSEKQWEETCDYYINNFPEPYASKWKKRKGKAIHKYSDFSTPLYTWEDVKNNSIKID